MTNILGTTESTLTESELYKKSVDLVNSQPGCQKVYTGFGIEEKSKLIWILGMRHNSPISVNILFFSIYIFFFSRKEFKQIKKMCNIYINTKNCVPKNGKGGY